MDFSLVVLGVLVLVVLAALARAFAVGRDVERAVAARDRAQAEAGAAQAEAGMSDEARRIEAEVGDLTEAELDEELARWSAALR